MRVLMVSQRMPPHIAGAELQALGLARALVAHGADVRIVTTKFAPRLASEETIDGLPVRRLPVVRVGRRPLRLSQFAATAAHVRARARDYDIVHAHCLSAASFGAAVAARARGVPVVMKPSLGGPDGEIGQARSSPASPLLMRILRGVDRFAVADPSLVEELVAAGIDDERIVLVPNGVDLTRFYPAPDRVATRAALGLPLGPIALFAGQLIGRKGIGQLIEAWDIAGIEGATLVVAGEGLEAAVVQRRTSRLPAGVVFVGVQRDIAELMRAVDLLVLPSRNESFGNVVIEAMACGLPVVVGRTGVAAQLGIDGVAGRLVDPEDPPQLAARLREILTAADRGRALGARGRELAKQFDIKGVARDYLSLYASLLKGTP